MQKKVFFATALVCSALLAPTVVQATSSENFVLPSFSNCAAPQGTLKVHYDTGTHWIVGNQTLQIGSDSVYYLTTPNYLQCFCPTEGSAGIETDWYGVGDVDADTIANLEAQGWLYVANGTDFDLQNMPYLAKNSNFSCAGGIGGETSPSPLPSPTESPLASPSATETPTPTPAATPSPTPENTSSSSANGSGQSSSSSSANTSLPVGGAILSAATTTPSGSVLGANTLAFTGHDYTKLADGFIAVGTLLALAGAFLYAKTKKRI